MTQVPIEAVALKLFTGIDSFEIMAIPFFILAGNFLTHGGVARRMIRFRHQLDRPLVWRPRARRRHGLRAVRRGVGLLARDRGRHRRDHYAGHGEAGLSQALWRRRHHHLGRAWHCDPALDRDGHLRGRDRRQRRVRSGRPARSSASVGQLFMAGVIPGAMLASMLGLTTFYRAWKNNYPRMPKATWFESLEAFRESVWGLLLVFIVMGGIYAGIFTPTEAAAMSAVYAFFIAVFVYKDMKLADVPRVLLGSASMSAMILYIITNAVLFSFLMTSEQIPQAITAWITGAGIGWIEFLLFVNILLLVAGNVMEPTSIVLITAPILFPVAVGLGIHPVHLGILMTVNMEIGMCHPPVGLNLYVASGIARMGITELTIAVWPWLLTMLVFLVFVTYVQELSLWLPRVLGMM